MLARQIGRVHRQAIRLLPTGPACNADASFEQLIICSANFRVQDPACTSSAAPFSAAAPAASSVPAASLSVSVPASVPRFFHPQIHRGFAASASGGGPSDGSGASSSGTGSRPPSPFPPELDARDADADADYENENEGDDSSYDREPDPEETALDDLLAKWEILMDGGALEANPVGVLDSMVAGEAPLDRSFQPISQLCAQLY